MAAVTATDAAVATTDAVRVVVRVIVLMDAVKAVRPVMSNALKAVKHKANAMAATAVDAQTAMNVANAVAIPTNSVPSIWTLTPRHPARSCRSQPIHAQSVIPVMSVVTAANVAKAVDVNATNSVPSAKTGVSATPKAVLTKAWHPAKIATMLSHQPMDAMNSAAAMDGAAMDVATSALAKTKAIAKKSSLGQVWRWPNPQHPRVIRLCLNKVTTQEHYQPLKAKDANLGSLVPVIVMVVNAVTVPSVRSKVQHHT